MVPAAPSGSATETDKEPNREKGRQGHGAGRDDCKQNSQTIVHDLYSGSVSKFGFKMSFVQPLLVSRQQL
jgi:hypothetical protein